MWLGHYEFLLNMKPIEEERRKLDPKQTKRIKNKRIAERKRRKEKDDNNQTNTPFQCLMCIKQ